MRLNVFLIPKWGILGAAIAVATTSIIGNLIVLIEVFILFRMHPYNTSFLKPVSAGLAALVTTSAVGQLLPSEVNYIYFTASLITVLVVYGGLILLFGLSEEDRAVLARLRTRLAATLP